MFADASVADRDPRRRDAALHDAHPAMDPDRTDPTDDDIAIARVIGDVWLSSLVAWVNRPGHLPTRPPSTWSARSGWSCGTSELESAARAQRASGSTSGGGRGGCQQPSRDQVRRCWKAPSPAPRVDPGASAHLVS